MDYPAETTWLSSRADGCRPAQQRADGRRHHGQRLRRALNAADLRARPDAEEQDRREAAAEAHGDRLDERGPQVDLCVVDTADTQIRQ